MMTSSRISTQCRRFSSFVLALAGLVMGLSATSTRAANYNIYWETLSYTSRGSNLDPILKREGGSFFEVNFLPIPTYTVPYQYLGDRETGSRYRYNAFSAKFNSVLLTPGPNSFYFGVTTVGGDERTLTTECVRLLRDPLPPIPLFNVERNGTAFTGQTTVSMGLKELNPELASRIESFDRSLREDQNKLLANAAQIQDLGAKQERLNRLQVELNELLSKGYDELTAAELDSLLARYSDVPPATRNALVALVADLKKNVEQLRAEILRITNELTLHVDEAVALVEAAVAQAGHDLNAPGSFETGSGLDNLPDVASPDLGTRDDFNPAVDSYAVYAQSVLDRLDGYVVSGTGSVKDRLAFQSTVRGWKLNIEAIRKALSSRAAVSNAEWAAFLHSRQRVATFIRDFVDESGWFLDSPVPADIRNQLDGVLMAKAPKGAAALKDALSGWKPEPLTPEQRLLLDTINAMLQGAAAAVFDTDLGAIAALNQLAEATATAAVEVARVSAGFTPVGDVLDLCEAVTGKAFCVPTGQDLDVTDRVAAGLGVVVGQREFWIAAGNVLPLGHSVAGILYKLSDLAANERSLLVARLGNTTLAHLEGLTGRQIKLLADRFGDQFVNNFASNVGKRMGDLEALDIFADKLSKEVKETLKTKGAAVREFPSLSGKSLSQVQETLTQRNFIKQSSDAYQEIWTHADGSVVRIAPNGTSARPNRPHVKKEISHTPHKSGPSDIACKVTDDNVLTPQGPNQAEELFNQWFRKAIEAKKNKQYVRDLTDAERKRLMSIWGDVTHIDIVL